MINPTDPKFTAKEILNLIAQLASGYTLAGGLEENTTRARAVIFGLAQILQELALLHCSGDADAAVRMVSAAVNATNERAVVNIRQIHNNQDTQDTQGGERA